MNHIPRDQWRREEVAWRASRTTKSPELCYAIGCNNPTVSSTGKGLDRRFCRHHMEHKQRHGSWFKGSYTANTLNPYRQAALLWLLENPDDFWVKDAVSKVQRLYEKAGPFIEAFRLRGLRPRERANAHWARLRHHEVDPRIVIAAWLAVELAERDDQQPELRREFKRVQAAKVVHRMASGSHRTWQQDFGSFTHKQELHVYPPSRGRILRHIGADIEFASELVVDHHLDAIHELKKERDKRGRFESSPYPRGQSAKRLASS